MSSNIDCMFKASLLFSADTPNSARVVSHIQLSLKLVDWCYREISYNTGNIKLHAKKVQKYNAAEQAVLQTEQF